MGSIIGRIHNDYEDYRELCEFLDIEPISIHRVGDEMSFYEHEQQILDEEGCITRSQVYQKVK